MNRAHHTSIHALSLALGALFAASVASAQDAYTYIVRDASDRYETDGSSRDLDVSTDRDPVRVVQGPALAWIVPEGDPVSRESAVGILSEGAPLEPGPGGLMLRGWNTVGVVDYTSFSMTLDRGARDRDVAGRAAHHYILESRIERTDTDTGQLHRYSFHADLWVIPDVPHSWAPFGVNARSLPGVAPRLRARLGPRLDTLGLVARAVIRLELAAIEDGRVADRSRETTRFEVSSLEPAEPPPGPGPIVDRSVMEALEERLTTTPTDVCVAVARSELPSSTGPVSEAARSIVLATLNDDCGRSELYFTMLEDRLESEPDTVCERVRGAADPAALAAAVFTDAQRTAFMTLVPESERPGFHDELRRYCEARHATDHPRSNPSLEHE